MPSLRGRILNNPLYRLLFAVVAVVFLMHMLRTTWKGQDKGAVRLPARPVKQRKAVAHFMLGNTYPYTEKDWQTTLQLAEETGLDGLALNLGPEDWQSTQAQSAFTLLSSGPSSRLKLFLSLDCTVLPTNTVEDGQALLDKTAQLLRHPSYMLFQGKRLLSTFGGERTEFGGWGWQGWLERLNRELGEEVFFMPGFFLPPDNINAMEHVDGMFNWNSAWPLTNRPKTLNEDEPFLDFAKPYMASISPLFFTHYGTTGQWAFNKNFIYRSDDLLYPSRWNRFLALPPSHSPDIIQIVSWNDFGESHNIAPISGAQPGSEAWTSGMSHEAFREMTWYFIGRWRDHTPEVGGAIRVWMWYRPHPANMVASGDEVGPPEHSEWAQDLINVMILAPQVKAHLGIHIKTGSNKHTVPLHSGQANTFTVPFVPGPVTFEITADRQGVREVVLGGTGREIAAQTEKYNFNMWTGSWRAKFEDPK